MTIFGYTVRLPDIEPFKGEDRAPQFIAKKVKIIATIAEKTSKQLQRAASYNYILAVFENISSYLYRNFRFHSNSQLTDTVLFSILAE